MTKKTIRVGIADVVEVETLIEGEVEIDLGWRLGQGHTLWFDLEPFDSEQQYGYTRYCCIRRDRDHEETELLLHKVVYLQSGRGNLQIHIEAQEDDVEVGVGTELMMTRALNKQTGEYRRRVETVGVETAL